jgi:hypothetical protein
MSTTSGMLLGTHRHVRPTAPHNPHVAAKRTINARNAAARNRTNPRVLQDEWHAHNVKVLIVCEPVAGELSVRGRNSKGFRACPRARFNSFGRIQGNAVTPDLFNGTC